MSLTTLAAHIAFPRSEHRPLKARLAEDKPVVTTRILRELGRYAPGQRLDSALGPDLLVERVRRFEDAGKHPFARELTPEQQRQLAGRPYEVLELTKAAYDYASTQFDIEGPLKAKLLAFGAAIPGQDKRPHITVKYGLKTDDAGQVAAALAGRRPVTVTLGKTSVFPPARRGGKAVVKLEVKGEGLHALHQHLARRLKNRETFRTYKPHLTLAYVRPETAHWYAGRDDFDGERLTVDKVTFSTKGGRKTVIPLTKTAKDRAMPITKAAGLLDTVKDRLKTMNPSSLLEAQNKMLTEDAATRGISSQQVYDHMAKKYGIAPTVRQVDTGPMKNSFYADSRDAAIQEAMQTPRRGLTWAVNKVAPGSEPAKALRYMEDGYRLNPVAKATQDLGKGEQALLMDPAVWEGNPAITGHEFGHAVNHGSAVGTLLKGRAFRGPVESLGQQLGKSQNQVAQAVGKGAQLTGDAIGAATLADEALASARSRSALRELGAQGRPVSLDKALGTYAANEGLAQASKRLLPLLSKFKR